MAPKIIMTKFFPFLKNQCIKVTLMIQNSPCGKIFIEPVDTQIETDMTDYFVIIKDPQDIQTILKKLKDNTYLTCEDWEHDMNLVFDNGVLYYSQFDRKYEAAMAKIMKDKLSKLINRYILPIKSTAEWIQAIAKYYNRFNDIMSKYPPSLEIEFANKPFSSEDLETNQMKKYCNQLNQFVDSPSTQFKLIQLLTLCGIKIDSKKKENHFDLAQMPNETLQALIFFVNHQFSTINE